MIPATRKPYISYHAMAKAAPIVRDFVLFYFPLYEIPPEKADEFCPILLFTQSIIFQTDRELEDGKYEELPWTRDKNFIIEVLKELDIFHPMIEKHLKEGDEYVRLEEKIIKDKDFTYEDVVRTAEVRSCDLRTLHHILISSLKIPYDDQFLALVWPMEVMIDLETDLQHYPDDVASDDYNTYRMLVKLYGNEAPRHFQELHDHYENLVKERLSEYPVEQQQKYLAVYKQYFDQFPMPPIPDPIIE